MVNNNYIATKTKDGKRKNNASNQVSDWELGLFKAVLSSRIDQEGACLVDRKRENTGATTMGPMAQKSQILFTSPEPWISETCCWMGTVSVAGVTTSNAWGFLFSSWLSPSPRKIQSLLSRPNPLSVFAMEFCSPRSFVTLKTRLVSVIEKSHKGLKI